MRLADALIRRRHRLGFGVHSPFAFSFVNDVIRSPHHGYAYYNDVRVHKLLCSAHPATRAGLTLLFRLTARSHHTCIFISPQLPQVLKDVIRQAVKHVPVKQRIPSSADSGNLIVATAAEATGLRAPLPADLTLVVPTFGHDDATTDSIAAMMPGGWTFEGTSMAIFITAHNELCRLKV